jgi:hypothetical protein
MAKKRWRRAGIAMDLAIAGVASAGARFVVAPHVVVADRATAYTIVVTLAVGLLALAVAPITIMVALAPGPMVKAAMTGGSRREQILSALKSGITMSAATAFASPIAWALDKYTLSAQVLAGLVVGLGSAMARLGRQWLAIVNIGLNEAYREALLEANGGAPVLRQVGT